IQDQTRVSPTYHVTKSEGPDHAKTFWVEVKARGEILGNGMGKSKQEAESAAAANALAAMGKT
ncbi:ribonuclease III, partial [Candidatus Gottesmanbacteria bacterium]|nr:ribonuclease III [Candidatus Gottesmanbacteria bacterium]